MDARCIVAGDSGLRLIRDKELENDVVVTRPLKPVQKLRFEIAGCDGKPAAATGAGQASRSSANLGALGAFLVDSWRLGNCDEEDPSGRKRHPRALVQHPARHAGAAGALPQPADPAADGTADLAPIFPQAIIAQRCRLNPGSRSRTRSATSTRSGPSPLYRADRLESAGHARSHLLKYEGVSPAGSHKPNTAVPQATTTPRKA